MQIEWSTRRWMWARKVKPAGQTELDRLKRETIKEQVRNEREWKLQQQTEGERMRVRERTVRVKILKCLNCLKWCWVSKAVESKAAEKSGRNSCSTDESWLFTFHVFVCRHPVLSSTMPLLYRMLVCCIHKLIICISAHSWIIFFQRLEWSPQESSIQLNYCQDHSHPWKANIHTAKEKKQYGNTS